jgi:L-alanine-DL-glutamate epimerase-like enolase superfamily enzyme
VELVEEPLAGSDPEAWRRLQAASPVPLALDESLDHGNLAAVLERRAARCLVLKPMRLGGLLPCLEIARRAREAGLLSLITTSIDGAVAGAAAAHLAAALDAAAVPAQTHGLATAALLSRDLAEPLPVARGGIDLPGQPGLGVTPYRPCDENR